MEVGSSGEWRKKEWERKEEKAVRADLYSTESRHAAWRDSVALKHVARLSLAMSGPLARVCQRGSSVAPKHVA